MMVLFLVHLLYILHLLSYQYGYILNPIHLQIH